MTDENNWYQGRGKIIAAGTPTVREPLRRPGNNDVVHGAGSSSPPNTRGSSFKGLSADAPEFIPRSAMNVPQQIPQAVPLNGEGDYVDNVSLDQVKTVIYELSENPGEFDTLARHLADALNVSVGDENTLSAVVNEIFEQSMSDVNLRYNGSRLCNYLSNHLNTSFGEHTFRFYLLNSCNREFNLRSTYASSPEGRTRLRDFAMLLGELFIHLEMMVNNVPTRMTLLGITLPDLLDTLLMHSSPVDVKCVCQILKFTGAAMEDLPGNDLKKLNALFEVMKALASQENIERTSKDMLENVIKLKECNWGRGTPPSTPDTLNSFQLPVTGPIFYGPDGVPISSEETRFLESDKYLYDHPDDDYSESEYANQNAHLWSSADGGDDGMDDEMTEAFEKFLLENS